MDFDATMRAIDELAGVEVAVEITGLTDDAPTIAFLGGVLRPRPESDEREVLVDGVSAVERAATFGVGEHWNMSMTFWPSQFVIGERLAAGRGVRVTTADAVLRVYANRPWID